MPENEPEKDKGSEPAPINDQPKEPVAPPPPTPEPKKEAAAPPNDLNEEEFWEDDENEVEPSSNPIPPGENLPPAKLVSLEYERLPEEAPPAQSSSELAQR